MWVRTMQSKWRNNKCEMHWNKRETNKMKSLKKVMMYLLIGPIIITSAIIFVLIATYLMMTFAILGIVILEFIYPRLNPKLLFGIENLSDIYNIVTVSGDTLGFGLMSIIIILPFILGITLAIIEIGKQIQGVIK